MLEPLAEALLQKGECKPEALPQKREHKAKCEVEGPW